MKDADAERTFPTPGTNGGPFTPDLEGKPTSLAAARTLVRLLQLWGQLSAEGLKQSEEIPPNKKTPIVSRKNGG